MGRFAVGELAPRGPPNLEIQVVSAFSGEELCKVAATRDWSVLNTKAQIEFKLGVPIYMQHLMVGPTMLCDGESLGKIFDIQPAGIIRLVKSAAGLVSSDYMADQTEINGKMRAVLVDWLVKVHKWCKFRSETLFLTVALLDRYLAQKMVARKMFQLTGVTALLIAAKFEEVHVPKINDIVYVCDQAYTRKQVRTTECLMLVALGFHVHCPTVAHFLAHPEEGLEDECWGHIRFTDYLAELSLHDLGMLHYAPSDIAAAAQILSSEVLGPWPSKAEKEICDAPEDCINELRGLMNAAPFSSYQTSRTKLMRFMTEAQCATLKQMGI